MPNGNPNGRKLEGGGRNGSKERQGNGELPTSSFAGLRVTSGHGESDMKASLKRKMGPSSQISPKKRNARSYWAWQKCLKQNSNVTDKCQSEGRTFNAHKNTPVDKIFNGGGRTEGTGDSSDARIRCSNECTTSLDVREKLRNSQGNRERKKMLYGVHSVSEGVESICKAWQKGVFDKNDDKPMVHEGKKLHDTEQSMHNGLKPELAELCEVLRLPEDVKAMVGRFLEYLIENYHISRNSVNFADAYQNDNMNTESKTWQAFKISLCWMAASLVKHKIKHSESVVRAKKDLNYSCEKEDVDVAYSILRCLKEVFLHHLERPIFPKSSQSTESYTKDVSTSISCSSSEPPNFNIDAETSSVPKETSDWNGTSDSLSIPELQAAQRGLSKTKKWIEKKCNKKCRELLRKQKEENDDFKCGMDQTWKKLDAKQLEVCNKILTSKVHWTKLVTSWAQTEMTKHHSGCLSCAEDLPSIPTSETMPDEQVMLAGGECILDILENIIAALPLEIPDGQNVASGVLGPPPSGKEIPFASLSRSPIEENQLLIAGTGPNGCDVEVFQRSEMRETFSQVYEVQENNVPKKQSSAPGVMENMDLVLPPSSEDEVPSVSLSCSPTETNQLVRTGSSLKGCGVEASYWSEMRENNALEEQSAALHATGNMAPALSPSETQMPSLSHSCSPTHETMDTVHQVSEVQEDTPQQQYLGELLVNITQVIPLAFQNEVHCASHPCGPSEEIQSGTGSSPVMLEGNNTNTGGVVEVCKHNLTREPISQVSKTQEIALQEQNVLPIPNALSALSPCNLGPQHTEQTSLVQNVPSNSIAEDRISLSDQSLASATSEALAEDASNVNVQTTSQEVQATVSYAAASLIDVNCRDPEILASEPEEGMQGSVSHISHFLDLPSIDENLPHCESQAIQSSQACRQLEENQIGHPNEDVLRPWRYATTPSCSSSHFMSSTKIKSSQTPLHLSDDPLQNEIESIRKEREKIFKIYEDTSSQLILDCKKEMEQIRKKYEAKLKENESCFFVRNSELVSNYNLALRNKALADSFQLQCKGNEAFQLGKNCHVRNSSTLQHQVRIPLQIVAPAIFSPSANLQSNLLPTPQTMDHQTQFIEQLPQGLSHTPTRSPPFTGLFLSKERSPCSNSVHVPVWNISAERQIHGPSTATLLSMQCSSQMSPGIPARPPLINNVCLTAGTPPTQSEIHGLQPFRSVPLHGQPVHLNPPRP